MAKGLFDDVHNPRVRDIVGTGRLRGDLAVRETVEPLTGDLDDGLVDEAGHYVDPDARDYPVYARRFDHESSPRATLGFDSSVQ